MSCLLRLNKCWIALLWSNSSLFLSVLLKKILSKSPSWRDEPYNVSWKSADLVVRTKMGQRSCGGRWRGTSRVCSGSGASACTGLDSGMGQSRQAVSQLNRSCCKYSFHGENSLWTPASSESTGPIWSHQGAHILQACLWLTRWFYVPQNSTLQCASIKSAKITIRANVVHVGKSAATWA